MILTKLISFYDWEAAGGLRIWFSAGKLALDGGLLPLRQGVQVSRRTLYNGTALDCWCGEDRAELQDKNSQFSSASMFQLSLIVLSSR